jgi:hypothetical protein
MEEATPYEIMDCLMVSPPVVVRKTQPLPRALPTRKKVNERCVDERWVNERWVNERWVNDGFGLIRHWLVP